MVPDGDMFKAISNGSASVVTDRIARFAQRGIALESGAELEADIVVTATGMRMVPFGKINFSIDGERIDLHDHLVYKSMMLSAIPNFAFIIGYTNNSWTLKVDLVAKYVCRLLAHMDQRGYCSVTPIEDGTVGTRRPYIAMESGYVSRAMHLFPQRGSHGHWAAEQDYSADRIHTRLIEDPALQFTPTPNSGAGADRGAMNAPAVISVVGRRTRVRIDGDPAAPPILLLHGIGRSLEDWDTQYARLSERHRVIGLDIPGFGFSARIRRPATLTSLAHGVIETLDALGEQRPLHIVGNSLGGAIAMQILAAEPSRVAKLVLANSAGFDAQVSPMLRALSLPIIGKLTTVRASRLGTTLIERMLYADHRLATAARIDHALAIARETDGGTVMVELAAELITARGVRAGWRSDLMTAIAAHPRPTLLIWGDRDRILAPHHLFAAKRLLPHARTHMYAGVGHTPQIERPDDFADQVLAFLGERAIRGARRA
jgi:pimeloyl-ACP methyl ester carboxylesterase